MIPLRVDNTVCLNYNKKKKGIYNICIKLIKVYNNCGNWAINTLNITFKGYVYSVQ